MRSVDVSLPVKNNSIVERMEREIVIKETPLYRHSLKRLKPLNARDYNAYILVTNRPDVIRKGVNEDGKRYVMPGWGPMITEGQLIPKTNIFVESLSFVKTDNGTKYVCHIREHEDT